MSFVLRDNNSGYYFVNPSFSSWDLTQDVSQATSWETEKEAREVGDEVNRAIGVTYWDYADIVPHAVVTRLIKLVSEPESCEIIHVKGVTL